jgi:hypothetical protein
MDDEGRFESIAQNIPSLPPPLPALMVADPTIPMHRQEAVSQSLNALINGKVPDAVTVSSNYFGGAGTLYEKETAAIIECILDHDFTPDPTIKPKVLKPLRVIAAAMELWGESDVQEFAEVSGDWTYKFKPEEVIQLLYAAGLERHRLDHLRHAGVRQIAVRNCADQAARICQETIGRIFAIEEAPILPHGDPACRCSYATAPSS